MVGRRLAGFAAVMAASYAMMGCCGGSSPKQTCEKYKKLSDDDNKKFDMDECVKNIEEMKAKDAKLYECVATCTDKADTMEAADKCPVACAKIAAGIKDSPQPSEDDNAEAPIDKVTSGEILSQLEREYSSKGFSVVNQSTTASGDWVAEVMIGNKTSGDLDVFQISLSSVGSRKEAYALIETLGKKAAGPKEGRAGRSKALLVACQQHRSAGGSLGACVYSTTQVSEVANTIAKR